MKSKGKCTLLLFILFSSCIGTDLVEEQMVPERIVIQRSKAVIEKGDTVNFTGTCYDKFGYKEKVSFQWLSSNDTLFQFISGGLGVALDTGMVEISTMAKGVTQMGSFTIFPLGQGGTELQSREGSFVKGDGGYDARGTARLKENMDGSLTLEFLEDFSTSNGSSVYVFLANKTSGPFNYKEGGNEVNSTSAQITKNKLQWFSGKMQFKVPAGITIDNYDHVVLYCILGPVFGYAKLNP